jgi:starch-binding outer membrane protein, SusD/RagB family
VLRSHDRSSYDSTSPTNRPGGEQMPNTSTARLARFAGRRLLPAGVPLVFLAGACQKLTDINTPDVILADDINTAFGAQSRASGALRIFSASGVYTSVLYTGLITDELTYAYSTGTIADARRIPEQGSSSANSAFGGLQSARVAALEAADALERYSPTSRGMISRMFSLMGLSEVMLAEQICSGVPLTRQNDTRIEYGDPLTTTQLLQHAVSQFDSALAYTDTARYQQLARVGKARALVDLGKFAEAAALVSPALVPTSFRYDAEYSAAVSTQSNSLYSGIATSRIYSVANLDGGTGLNFRTANDPRVATVLIGPSLDNSDQIFTTTALNGLGAPFAVATGVEARLIEAEAALQAGDVTGWLAKLNEARASRTGLAPLTDPGTAAARVDLLFRERAFWMFLTAHRQGDLRRLIRQYGRSQASVFPSQGLYRDGGPYGSDVTQPIPEAEQYNPKFKACLDRNA